VEDLMKNHNMLENIQKRLSITKRKPIVFDEKLSLIEVATTH
jgi:hypothetical protein